MAWLQIGLRLAQISDHELLVRLWSSALELTEPFAGLDPQLLDQRPARVLVDAARPPIATSQ
jgi:hypothetical protein